MALTARVWHTVGLGSSCHQQQAGKELHRYDKRIMENKCPLLDLTVSHTQRL